MYNIGGRFCLGTNCPIGTYSNQEGLVEEADCTLCDPGKYCDTPGLTAPAGDCEADHYCDSAATRSNPETEAWGYLCPEGSYCPQGIRSPVGCIAGTYNPTTGEQSWDTNLLINITYKPKNYKILCAVFHYELS